MSPSKKKPTAIKAAAAKSAATKSAAPRDVVQEALQVTWLLKGNLKNDNTLKVAGLYDIGSINAGGYSSVLA